MNEDRNLFNIKYLPHIPLKAVDGTRIRGVGFGITRPISKPITDQDFINKINSVIDITSTKLNSKIITYFLIELTIPYYNKSVMFMLKKLNLQLKSVMSDFSILVSTEPEKLSNYIKRKKLHKGVLNVIKDIKQLESSMKISKSLQKIMREDVDKKKAINILIRLLNKLDQEEQETCLRNLSALLYSEQSLTLHKKSKTINCICSTALIPKIADLPFIKLISESPKIQRLPSKEDELVLYMPNEVVFKEEESTLPPICIIDSGISPILERFTLARERQFNFFSLEENIPHGTSVASIAIFGEDLLEGKNILKSKTKVISFKIDDEEYPPENINLEEAIMEAVSKYKDKTKIFNLSYNYDLISNELRREMMKRIDHFVQKENIILVNSVGNISLDKAYHLKENYPKYLTQNNIFCPSEGRNIFSVGSIALSSNESNIKYSAHTRIGIPPDYQDEESDKYEFFKPEIHTYGGDSFPDDITRSNKITANTGFPVISTDGKVIYDLGTSYSAPLISLCFARLYAKFGNILKNSETYKAMLINQSKYSNCEGFTTFNLLDTKEVGNCNDAIYLSFEGESTPHEKAENKKRSQVIKCKSIKFYVPKEAESIDAVIVHSNNYEDQELNKYKTKIILKFVKPNGVVCKKEYGNVGRNSAITYGKYNFKRDYEGEWIAEAHIETAGIPPELFNTIKVRFGISVKVNLKREFKKEIKRLYEQVYNNTKCVDSLFEKQISPEIIAEKENRIQIPLIQRG